MYLHICNLKYLRIYFTCVLENSRQNIIYRISTKISHKLYVQVA